MDGSFAPSNKVYLLTFIASLQMRGTFPSLSNCLWVQEPEVEFSKALSAIIRLICSRSAGLTEYCIGCVWPTMGSEHCTWNSYSDKIHMLGLDVK